MSGIDWHAEGQYARERVMEAVDEFRFFIEFRIAQDEWHEAATQVQYEWMDYSPMAVEVITPILLEAVQEARKDWAEAEYRVVLKRRTCAETVLPE